VGEVVSFLLKIRLYYCNFVKNCLKIDEKPLQKIFDISKFFSCGIWDLLKDCGEALNTNVFTSMHLKMEFNYTRD
jgi:hypothetical protein